MNMIENVSKHKFLLNQLVAREFKVKYKRSLLGIMWSLLNPLLIMSVQYIVFSKLFKFDLPNYPVYLLSGTILFNFFSEATNQALISITGNAQLITKVYVPKEIFPLSKVISALINLCFSFIALYIMIIASGLKITILHVLIPFGMIGLFLFTVGFSYLLACMMVFFRDMQFLHGIIITAWTYLTPIFYPENILPDQFKWVLQVNPIHHYIKYIRSIILYNQVPSMSEHLICLFYAIGSIAMGLYVFRKMESKLVLNL